MPVPVISLAQMREWESATWKTGQTEVEVIRRAGQAIATLALRLTQRDDFILVLAGKGNNGADAHSTIGFLNQRRVTVLEVRDPEHALSELEQLLGLHPALVIDGLFGIGLNRPLDLKWIQLIERVNTANLRVLAVDVPSGLNSETGEPQGAAIQAALTLTVGAPKSGLLQASAWPCVGRLEVANEVGLIPCPFTAEFNWTLPDDFAGFPPARPVAGHKGTFGHLAILAGSHGYHGAAVLTARAAQRAQPGLITLFPHETAYSACAAQLQAVMVQPWSESLEFPGDFSALLAGPGLASPDIAEGLKQSVRRLWRTASVPMVVDASALGWLAPGPVAEDFIRVITPHPGEAARLLKKTSAEVQNNRLQSLRELSRQFGNCWVVLKGHQTLVGRSSGQVFVNSSGNPYLAQGGSGDVLAGYLAGLLAQRSLQQDAFKTIRYAVWQHGATADALQIRKPNWIIEDLVEALGLSR
jgi:ADP-dependent NAD(P)H-hydrate dehydratase / NAD(P)H-hydrate epimerase